ncbi:hypothetical protein K435DRAFT_871249 [Dendrothele bispora CBS 962.96]|uniref:Uncharacterized protein n=1 Tax=Dendrothele bispora (strain CBS 962.96) TaxID=1314807 RepID=A0A4S8L5Y6_DENBC|nr:hypothetical protein K435DRAFT_871249 [Dendrothele bispora CBS 962.96]
MSGPCYLSALTACRHVAQDFTSAQALSTQAFDIVCSAGSKLLKLDHLRLVAQALGIDKQTHHDILCTTDGLPHRNGSTTVRQPTASLQPSRLDDEFNNIPGNDETENLPRLQVNSEENKNDQRYPNYKRGDDPAGLFDEEITEMQKSEDEVQSALVKMEADRLLPYLPTSPRFDDSDCEQEHVKAKEISGRFVSTSPERSGRERAGTSSVAPSVPVKASSSKNNKTRLDQPRRVHLEAELR